MAAIKHLEQVGETAAKRRLPAPPQFDFILGDTLARSGRIPQAEAAFQREIRLHPDNLEAYSSLALCQMMLDHQKDASLKTLELMCANNPGAPARNLAADDMKKWGHPADAARFHAR